MEQLKSYRAANNLSQSEMGALVGLSQTMISLIESGKRQIPADRCLSFEAATNGKLTRHMSRPDVFGKAPKKKKAD